jgi:hypothetical protein
VGLVKISDVDPDAPADVAGVIEGLLNIVSGLTVHINEQDELIEPEDLLEDLDGLLMSGQRLVHHLRSLAAESAS